MKTQKGFILRMQEHLKKKQFHLFPQEDIWGKRVEYDLENQEIRFIPEDYEIPFDQYSPFQLGESLHRLHNASVGFHYPNNHPLNLTGKWSEQWFKRLKRIQKHRDQMYKQGIQTTFEDLFLENYSYFNQLAQVALFYLEDHQYPGNLQEFESYGTLAYRSFSWDDVEKGDQGYLFIRPENWVIDIPARDLGQFMRNSSLETLSLDDSIELLKGYQKERELQKPEYELIYALMLYPSKWVRMVERYLSRQNYSEVDWEEEMRELNQSYQEWENVLGEYSPRINEEFGAEITPIEWLQRT